MRQKRAAGTGGGKKTIRDIRRARRRLYLAEENIRIALDGLIVPGMTPKPRRPRPDRRTGGEG